MRAALSRLASFLRLAAAPADAQPAPHHAHLPRPGDLLLPLHGARERALHARIDRGPQRQRERHLLARARARRLLPARRCRRATWMACARRRASSPPRRCASTSGRDATEGMLRGRARRRARELPARARPRGRRRRGDARLPRGSRRRAGRPQPARGERLARRRAGDRARHRAHALALLHGARRDRLARIASSRVALVHLDYLEDVVGGAGRVSFIQARVARAELARSRSRAPSTRASPASRCRPRPPPSARTWRRCSRISRACWRRCARSAG